MWPLETQYLLSPNVPASCLGVGFSDRKHKFNDRMKGWEHLINYSHKKVHICLCTLCILRQNQHFHVLLDIRILLGSKFPFQSFSFFLLREEGYMSQGYIFPCPVLYINTDFINLQSHRGLPLYKQYSTALYCSSWKSFFIITQYNIPLILVLFFACKYVAIIVSELEYPESRKWQSTGSAIGTSPFQSPWFTEL